jgi:hypothetical protein
MSGDLDKALRLVMNLLPEQGVTEEVILEHCEDAITLLAKRGGLAPDLNDLVRHIEALVIVKQDLGASLVDKKGHVDWLRDKRAEPIWRYWDRYRVYLEDTQHLPRQVVLRLDEVTDSVLGKLEDPSRSGAWDRRGLVVGQVQSGKTSNYTGLICKAADSGYKLIVVLAGIHNSLRSQTQLRLDEGFLGFDTQYQTRSDDAKDHHFIGVGGLLGFKPLRAGSLTTSAENGDFNLKSAKQIALPIGDYPVILVVKKHAKILSYIHTWVTSMHGATDAATGRKVVADVPLLVIDDEADNASIDTNKEEALRPTAINRELRRLLHAFDKSAYVGYTATPFANIYADPYENDPEFGEDVFPRSFIESLRAPSNYFGPERVFGLGDDERGAIPIHNAIEDFDEWMPDRHKTTWRPEYEKFPASLRGAMLDFLLSCAARRARGQQKAHNSMLIHVTRFVSVQGQVADQVAEELLGLKGQLRYGTGSGADLMEELRDRWEQLFVPTSQWFQVENPALQMLDWSQVKSEILPAVEKIQVRTMNGSSTDALDYYEQRDAGLSVIAIGGDKLSRGLTLEGLSVSYYLRASKMYDTLMQMGRWFGYRPGYEDLCRLYTTPALRAWYREITLASDELRSELEEMAAQGATPVQYGLRVRTSPAGLSVTAANKMRRAQKVRLSFSGANPETILFDTRPAVLARNLQAAADLAEGTAGATHVKDKTGNLVFSGDLGEQVVHFLDMYQSDPMAWRVRPDLIAQYIRRGLAAGELGDWTVAFISNEQADRRCQVGKLDIGLTRRALMPDGEQGTRLRELEKEHRYAIRRVLSPTDELIDLSEEQRSAALVATRNAFAAELDSDKQPPKIPSGPAIRRLRPPSQALLLLYFIDNIPNKEFVAQPMVGFFLSFPHSQHDIAAEYAVNPVWQQLQLEGLVPEDDGDEGDDL